MGRTPPGGWPPKAAVPQCLLSDSELAAANGNGALTDARRSHELSPNYPDAMKLWGDALARQGRWRAALAKYDAALQLAPAWPALHQARDLAARKL